MTQIITRFAPSPTGILHLGNARTALFNWLFARATGGKFLLRVEDTDRERSTDEAVDVIFDSLKWLGLNWDGGVVFQHKLSNRHIEIIQRLLDEDKAYYCTCTSEELSDMREIQKEQGGNLGYDGRCRDKGHTKGAVRIKVPVDPDGEIVVQDIVQGDVHVPAAQIDDMILLRSDGTPTYMLSVVVDDHDMNITHILRGDDHLTNAFRQTVIYNALGWTPPKFAHVPLIHGPDGSKLSKRHGAVGVGAYREMGYLPEAMCNFLLRLGWGHGDTEIISKEEAIKVFELGDIGRAPSRIDFAKLSHFNSHYMREMSDDDLLAAVLPFVETALEASPDEIGIQRLKRGLPELKERAHTLAELAHAGLFFVRQRPLLLDAEAGALLDAPTRIILGDVRNVLRTVDNFNSDEISSALKIYAKEKTLKLGKVAMPLRAALTGTTSSPSVFHVAEILGKDETLARLADVA